MKAKELTQELLLDCPGAWYGTAAHPPFGAHVAVDPKRALDAIYWLARRGLRPSGTDTLPDGAFLLRFDTMPPLAAEDNPVLQSQLAGE
jgi:hypothetical protein